MKMADKIRNLRTLTISILGLIFLGIFSYGLLVLTRDNLTETKPIYRYVASNSSLVKLYNLSFIEQGDIYRGSKVEIKEEIVNEADNKLYTKVIYEKKEYLIKSNALVTEVDNVVLEKNLFVRTPITIYTDETSSSIMSMANKGDEVTVLGFNSINSDGTVDRYKIKLGEITGYAYGKYLVLDKDEALKNYDEDGNYQTHNKRKDTLGGGAAGNLDYYPYEKPKFEDNVMPDEVRSLYLNTGVLGKIEEYINIAKNNNINAFVVDIKDNTSPGYPSEVMKELSPTNYANANNSFEKYKSAIKRLKDEGFYVIGRITVFKDSYYINDNPEDAIMDKETGTAFIHNGSKWPTAFSRNVWEFNVKLAKESVEEMGFNEIQFDYVRFPDRVRNDSVNLRNIYNEDKAQAIQRFLMYACDEIHKLGAYVSADVFGESAHNYVTAYGQYWGAISNVVDVISGMPYPDHFNKYEYNFDEVVWTVPYKLLKFWGENYVMKRQSEIPTSAKVRTWIQTYNTGRTPAVIYDADKVLEQINGLYDAGLTGGYMTWNAGSSIQKYTSIAPAFKKE